MKKNILRMMILIISLVLVTSNFGCLMTKSVKGGRELSGKQRAQAKEWLHSANLLYKVGDYNFALEYYEKLIKYYPGTNYAMEAQNKIDEIERKK